MLWPLSLLSLLPLLLSYVPLLALLCVGVGAGAVVVVVDVVVVAIVAVVVAVVVVDAVVVVVDVVVALFLWKPRGWLTLFYSFFVSTIIMVRTDTQRARHRLPSIYRKHARVLGESAYIGRVYPYTRTTFGPWWREIRDQEARIFRPLNPNFEISMVCTTY